jgi:peptidoglycan/LPS O-acetylase OafA/YrhL
MSDATSTSRNNASIDTMRAMAAFLVVMLHMDQCGMHLVPREWAVIGAGVPTFFALSGFLIARSILVRAEFDALSFIRSRARRILPNYYICILWMLFAVQANTLARSSGWQLLGDLGTHALLIHSWFGQFHASIIGPFWTLGHEWAFYLLMMLTAPLLRSRRGWMIPTAMLVVSIAAQFLILSKVWLPGTGTQHPFCYWGQFAVGIIAAWASTKRVRWHGLWLCLGLTLIAVVFLRRHDIAAEVAARSYLNGQSYAREVLRVWYERRSQVVWFPLLLTTGISFILVAVSTGCHGLRRFLAATPLPFLGTISYSTYLYHSAVTNGMLRAVKSHTPESLLASNAWACALGLIGIYGLSTLCYHFFERPFLPRRADAGP